MVPLRILLVDSHILFRKAMAAILQSHHDIEIVGEANDGAEGIRLARASRPDVILLDVTSSWPSTADVIQALKRECSRASVIATSLANNDQDLFQAVKNGGDGCIHASLSKEKLFELLDGIRMGRAPVSALPAARILEELPREDRGRKPTRVNSWRSASEDHALGTVARGLTIEDIALKLDMPIELVKLQISDALAKLHGQSPLSIQIESTGEYLHVFAPAGGSE